MSLFNRTLAFLGIKRNPEAPPTNPPNDNTSNSLEEIEFEDISITGVDDDMTTPTYGRKGYYDVYFILSSAPPDEWVKIFEHPAFGKPAEMHKSARCRIEGSYIICVCELKDVEPHHRPKLDQILPGVNTEYRGRLMDADDKQKAKLAEEERIKKEKEKYLRK